MVMVNFSIKPSLKKPQKKVYQIAGSNNYS